MPTDAIGPCSTTSVAMMINILPMLPSSDTAEIKAGTEDLLVAREASKGCTGSRIRGMA